jgi:hypothetical protein
VYATKWTIKTDKTVSWGVYLLHTGKVKQEEKMFDWAMKIHVSGEIVFDMVKPVHCKVGSICAKYKKQAQTSTLC